jgi:hypothetical protein
LFKSRLLVIGCLDLLSYLCTQGKDLGSIEPEQVPVKLKHKMYMLKLFWTSKCENNRQKPWVKPVMIVKARES